MNPSNPLNLRFARSRPLFQDKNPNRPRHMKYPSPQRVSGLYDLPVVEMDERLSGFKDNMPLILQTVATVASCVIAYCVYQNFCGRKS